MGQDGTVEVDGRTVAYTDYGGGGAPVLWCHGGPGSRREAEGAALEAEALGLRIIGVDRPGYGGSTAIPGRSIADWVPQGVAILDDLGLDRVRVIGVSTGGAYALALAAMAPERVSGVVACCALTDMRWAEGKALMMDTPAIAATWGAADRDTAMANAKDVIGEDGSKLLTGGDDAPPLDLPAADLELFADPTFLAGWGASMELMFAQGVTGFVDDRLADGPGWGSFDVGAVQCPVIVAHGGSDTVVPVAQAHHTASIVPGATVEIYDELGHFSIINAAVPLLSRIV